MLFSPDGGHLLTACRDFTARVWDWRTGKPVMPALTVAGKALNVAITRDGGHAVVGGFVEALEVVDLAELSLHGELDADESCLWAETAP